MKKYSFPYLLLFFCMGLVSCSDDNNNGPEVSAEDQQKVISGLGENYIVPAYAELASLTEQLDNSAGKLANELTEDQLATVQADLKAARLAWQNVNFLGFGPAVTVGLSSAVNIYPADTRNIERNITNGDYELSGVSSTDETGFATLGYLLHGTEGGTTEILASFKDSPNRLAYLTTVTGLISQSAREVATAWSVNGGNYLADFKDNPGVSNGSAMSLFVNGMIQAFEVKTRDGKIGFPAGLRSGGTPVPEAVEALYGGYSRELLLTNLAAYLRIFTGNGFNRSSSQSAGDSGLSFYLEQLGEETLARDIENSLALAITEAEKLQEPLNEDVVKNNDAAFRLIAALQRTVVLMKTDMASRMSIGITFQDNDGD